MARIPPAQKPPAAPSATPLAHHDSSSWAGAPDLAAVFALLASLGIGALIFTVMSIIALHG